MNENKQLTAEENYHGKAKYIGDEFPDYVGQTVDVYDDHSNKDAPCYKIILDGEEINNIDDCDIEFMEQEASAEEILQANHPYGELEYLNDVVTVMVAKKSMEEYATLNTQQLTDRINSLEDSLTICGNSRNWNKDKVKQLTAENERLREVQRWIPIEEKLPEVMEFVICFDGNEVYTRLFGRAWENLTIDEFRQKSSVTHWMPLPNKPELT